MLGHSHMLNIFLLQFLFSPLPILFFLVILAKSFSSLCSDMEGFFSLFPFAIDSYFPASTVLSLSYTFPECVLTAGQGRAVCFLSEDPALALRSGS